MLDVMLDIEAMGNGSRAAIIAIGACYFDPKTGEIGETFETGVSLQSCIERRMVMDASTVLWWMEQDKDAQDKFKCNSSCRSIDVALGLLRTFIQPNAKVWGNGSVFDNVIVGNAYKACGIPQPWKFRNDRDVRTVVELGQMVGFDPKRDMPFKGVKHCALDDAIHQAKYVSAIIKKLTS